MRQDALDIARKAEQIKQDHPWTAKAADAISAITTAVSISRQVNTRLLARSTLMAETLLQALESAVEAYGKGQGPEVWGTDYNKISAYAEKIVTDLRTADSGAALTPSAHLAALEAHYGEVEVDTNVALPIASPYEKDIREALNFKDELIVDLRARGISYITPQTLALHYPHALQASRGYTRGGQVISASGRPILMYYGFMTGAETKKKNITPQMLAQLQMTEVRPGETMQLQQGQTYIFNTYAQQKASQSHLMHPTDNDAFMTLVNCESDAIVRGPASFCAWDDRVLGAHKYGGFLGMRWAKRTPKGSLEVREDITLGARTVTHEKLLPTFLMSEIENSAPVYDVSMPISGSGQNTLIRYESTDHDGNAAISTLIFNGLMPADLKTDVINGHLDMRLLTWPCGLALQGRSADQKTTHILISVERTDRAATTPQPLAEVCRSLARMAAAHIILKEEAPKLESAPLLSQISITPRRPYDAAQMFVLTGEQGYTLEVSGPTTKADEIAISAALLTRSPAGKVRVMGAPNAEHSVPTPAAALQALLPGFGADDFWISQGAPALHPETAANKSPSNADDHSSVPAHPSSAAPFAPSKRKGSALSSENSEIIDERADDDQQDWTPSFD